MSSKLANLAPNCSRNALRIHCLLVRSSTSLGAGSTLRSSKPLPRWTKHSLFGAATLRTQYQAKSNLPSNARRGYRWSPEIGSEPGDDAHATKLDIDHESEIKIVDYSSEQVVEHDLTSSTLEPFLKEHLKPTWAACRWIYVNGINRDTVRCLGDYEGLHRLAMEDVLDTRTPTKVDWYDGHCFVVLTLQKLVQLHHQTRDEALASEVCTDRPSDRNRNQRRVNWRTFSPGQFGMSVEQVSVFLTSTNTVITIFEHSGDDVFEPILARLQTERTIIRSSNDPSMLVQAVIDTVVDISQPIGRAVGRVFDDLEVGVLAKPTIAQSKELYLLRSGLTLLMDNINATGGLIRQLCDHTALSNHTALRSQEQPSGTPAPPIHARPNSASTVSISPVAQVYLQDVQDHVRTLSTSTHMSIRSAENLTSLIFNTMTASQNDSVRQLTLVSTFFLPLTFLTGYFGMNFDPMPVVNEHSDAFFWWIATPVMMTTLLLMGTRMVRTRAAARKIHKRPNDSRGDDSNR